MGAKRIDQINELIREVLAEVIERTVEFPVGVLVTVKRVGTAKDLSSAKVWVSVLPAASGPAALKELQRALPELQREVAATIVLQFMPTLRFVLDQSEERAARITGLLDALKDNHGADTP